MTAKARNTFPAAGRGLASIHTHTRFCDGADDVETMCRAAHAKGLEAIGFSAHAPVFRATGMPTDWHLADGRLAEYCAAVRSARSRWEGKLAVYLGLELDYIKGLRSALDADITVLGLDYIIGSVHYVTPPRGPPFAVDGPAEGLERGIREGFGGDGEAMMHAYWDAVAEMIALGGFDILGHADLVKKNNQDGRWFNRESEDYRRRLVEIARAAGRAALVVEISTGGLNRRCCNETYPSPVFMRLFRENRVPVTITADAHCAGDLDGNYETARQTLLQAGYTEHVLFDGRKTGKPAWRVEQILLSGPADIQ